MKRFLTSLFNWYKKTFPAGNKIISYNIYVLGVSGTIGHPLYWFIWTYIDPQPYESIIVRTIGFFASLPLLFFKFLPDFLKKRFFYYWFFAVACNLSFVFTTHFILNSFSIQWSSAMIMMIMFSLLLIPNPLMLLANILFGVSMAIIYSNIVSPDLVKFDQHFFVTYIPLFGFAFAVGYAFSFSNLKGIISEERSKLLESLSGSIAHEIRNPLNNISLIKSEISHLIRTNTANMSSSLREDLRTLNSNVIAAIDNANGIIDMILADISEKPIESSDFAYLRPKDVLPQIIKQYGYRNHSERQKVRLDQSGSDASFVFKVVSQRFEFIVFNLLKNALYYTDQYPKSLVTLGAETREIDGKSYNAIFVYDEGPGVPKEIIPKLFDDFFTSGKKGGTGLGLSFCRRNMQIFDGDIICESEQFDKENDNKNSSKDNSANNSIIENQTAPKANWTKFSLIFPILTEEEVKYGEEEMKKRAEREIELKKSQEEQEEKIELTIQKLKNIKVLFADDQKVNRMMTKRVLENNGMKVTEVEDGSDLVESYKNSLDQEGKSSFDIILTDIYMTKVNGDEASIEIRKIEKQNNQTKQIPIIALTGNGEQSDIEHFLSCEITEYFLKGNPEPEKLLEVIERNVFGKNPS